MSRSGRVRLVVCDRQYWSDSGVERSSALLSAHGADVVRFPMKEAIASRSGQASKFDAVLFKENLPNDSPALRRATRFGCGSALFDGEWFRGHSVSKIAVRTRADVTDIGIHHATTAGPGGEETASGVCLLHFDCVGIEDWRQKWSRRLDGTGLVTTIRDNRAAQQALFRACGGDPARERALYNRLHTLTRREQWVLRLLGCVSGIRLDPRKFLPVTA